MGTDVYRQAADGFLRGQYDLAERLCRDMLTEDPENGSAMQLLGQVYQARGLLSEAAGWYAKAVLAEPGAIDCRVNLANVLYRQGDAAAAESMLREALQLRPDSASAWNNLGVVLKNQGRAQEAGESFQRALSLRPEYTEAWNNFGTTFRMLGRDDEAIECYLNALSVDEANDKALNNLGNALQAKGRLDEALACFGRALSISPDFAEGHWNRSIALLLSGNMQEGFAEYEWGVQAGKRPVVNTLKPAWRGEPLPDKTLLVVAEQGFGDTLQFARFLPAVKQRSGARLLLLCQPGLGSLLTDALAIDQVEEGGVEQMHNLPFDSWVRMMSLPTVLKLDPPGLFLPKTYLGASSDRIKHWSGVIGSGAGFRVGVVWAGNPTHQDDKNRSLPLDVLMPLAGIPSVRLYSLQKGPAADRLRDSGLPLVDLAPKLTNFRETAAAVANLDLVITADTAVAHLAGGMGKPVWVLLPFAPDWRWQLDGSDSPWYPSAHLYRQNSPGEWAEVVRRVAADLAGLLLSRI